MLLNVSAVPHPFELICDEDFQSLLVETVSLLHNKREVKAEGDAKHHVLAGIKQIVDDSDEYFMRPVIPKVRCNSH